MQSPTPNTTTHARTGAAAEFPSLSTDPGHHCDDISRNDRQPGGRNGSLGELARRSAAALTDTLDELITLQSELRSVVDIVARRPWTDDERQHYRTVARHEREALRRSAATHDWFDDVRARLDELDEPGGLGSRPRRRRQR
jgi:hypothetical protein